MGGSREEKRKRKGGRQREGKESERERYRVGRKRKRERGHQGKEEEGEIYNTCTRDLWQYQIGQWSTRKLWMNT